MDVVERARIFATAAHAAVGQVRKYTNEPYIVHPAEVVSIVRSVPHTPEMLAAAWLHDTVEDTDVTMEVVRAEFGDAVAELVGWLTDVSRPEDGNRAVRKARDREHTAAAPAHCPTGRSGKRARRPAAQGESRRAYRALAIALGRASACPRERLRCCGRPSKSRMRRAAARRFAAHLGRPESGRRPTRRRSRRCRQHSARPSR